MVCAALTRCWPQTLTHRGEPSTRCTLCVCACTRTQYTRSLVRGAMLGRELERHENTARSCMAQLVCIRATYRGTTSVCAADAQRRLRLGARTTRISSAPWARGRRRTWAGRIRHNMSWAMPAHSPPRLNVRTRGQMYWTGWACSLTSGIRCEIKCAAAHVAGVGRCSGAAALDAARGGRRATRSAKCECAPAPAGGPRA